MRPVPIPTTAASRADRQAGRRPEHQRTGHQVGWIRPGIQRRVEIPLGHCDVAGVVDEFGELGVGDRMPFDRERGHRHRWIGASSG